MALNFMVNKERLYWCLLGRRDSVLSLLLKELTEFYNLYLYKIFDIYLKQILIYIIFYSTVLENKVLPDNCKYKSDIRI